MLKNIMLHNRCNISSFLLILLCKKNLANIANIKMIKCKNITNINYIFSKYDNLGSVSFFCLLLLKESKLLFCKDAL